MEVKLHNLSGVINTEASFDINLTGRLSQNLHSNFFKNAQRRLMNMTNVIGAYDFLRLIAVGNLFERLLRNSGTFPVFAIR